MYNFLNLTDWVMGAILVVGGINWGLVGLFDINLVSSAFGEFTMLTRAVYTLVGISAIYVAASAIVSTSVDNNPSVVPRHSI